MEEPNKKLNPGDDSPEKKADPSNQVVDELKKFLSGLKGEQPEPPSPPPSPPEPADDPLTDADSFTFSQLNEESGASNLFSEKPDSDPFSFGMDNPFNDLQENEPKKEKPPDDEGFWKGNVLGWPESPSQEPPPEAPPSAESLMPKADPHVSPYGQDVSDQQIESLGESFPSSPITQEPPAEPPAPPERPHEPSQEPPQEPPPEQEPEVEMEIPIPGTVEKKQEESAPPAAQPEWDATDMKPSGLRQIACFFPEGEEAAAKTFIQKLKDASNRGAKPIDLQVAFLQGYAISQLDWKAAAHSSAMAGADTLFVLVRKEEKEKLQSLIAGAHVTWKGRLIRLDQVAIRSVYADLAFELGKTAS